MNLLSPTYIQTPLSTALLTRYYASKLRLPISVCFAFVI